MTKKPRPDKGSDWPGPRTVFRKLSRTLKKLAAGRKAKRKAARKKKKSRRRHGSR
jgi:hypothetical protein